MTNVAKYLKQMLLQLNWTCHISKYYEINENKGKMEESDQNFKIHLTAMLNNKITQIYREFVKRNLVSDNYLGGKTTETEPKGAL